MTGPLAQLYAMLLSKPFDPTPPPRPHEGLLEDRPLPPGLGPRVFRDPEQAGPAPPMGRGELARMYGGK